MSDFLSATYEDAFNIFCGGLLGQGIHRKVFECRIAPQYVVKVEDSSDNVWRYFANVKEMTFWNDHSEYKPIADWLAPCDYLSPDGRVLLQKRVEPLPLSYQLPEMLPTFLTDHKRENFGLFDGRLVCMDYAMTIPNPSRKLKKAHW